MSDKELFGRSTCYEVRFSLAGNHLWLVYAMHDRYFVVFALMLRRATDCVLTRQVRLRPAGDSRLSRRAIQHLFRMGNGALRYVQPT